MRTYLILAATAASLAFPAVASATDCGSAPKDQWMSEADIKARAVEQGYEVRKVKIEDGCYEIYGIGKDGTKAEVYFNPVNGTIVKVKADD